MTDQCPGPAQHGHPDVYESHCIHGETTPHNIIVTIERLRAKLAKAHAALKQMDCDCVLEMSPPEDHMKHDELCNYRIACQTLKEIDE